MSYLEYYVSANNNLSPVWIAPTLIQSVELVPEDAVIEDDHAYVFIRDSSSKAGVRKMRDLDTGQKFRLIVWL